MSSAATPHRAQGVLLKDRAYGELKERIVEGDIEPGALLTEPQLVSLLGMSKTPIRSALDRLEAEGLVKTLPKKAVLVREVTLREIADLFDLRIALETFVARHLLPALSSEQGRMLERNLEAQEICIDAGDDRGLSRLDMEFHLMLCDFGGNREILRVFSGLRDRMACMIRRNSRRTRDEMRQVLREHRAIAEALMAGNGEQAAALLRASIRAGRQLLLAR